MLAKTLLLLPVLLLTVSLLPAQTDTIIPRQKTYDEYIKSVDAKANRLQGQLDKSTAQLLSSLQKEENRLKRRLAKKDPAKATAVFGNAAQQYQQLASQLDNNTGTTAYIPALDSAQVLLKLLKSNPTLTTLSKDHHEKIEQALSGLKGLQSNFAKADQVKQFLQERKQYLKSQLDQLGLAKEMKRFNKQAYYYSAQVNEYKALLKDRKKAERKALELISHTKLFGDFMQRNSMLASLFRMPGDPTDPSQAVNLSGLQTRAQVNNLIQQQVAAGGPNAQAQISQNIQQAQSELNDWKNKLSRWETGSGDALSVPEGFQPNHQKTKTFLERIEMGANVQSQKPNGYFPVTSDIALTAGYKINDKSIIGVGAGYKMGWGQNIRHIRITHEGVSLRSFLDIKLKGSFWASGGYEMNYFSSFRRIRELQQYEGWQPSGLIGMSKVMDMRSQLLKKAKVQLYWDFLHAQQMPKAAAWVFRIAYGF